MTLYAKHIVGFVNKKISNMSDVVERAFCKQKQLPLLTMSSIGSTNNSIGLGKKKRSLHG